MATKLIEYHGIPFTEDTIQALVKLVANTVDLGWGIHFSWPLSTGGPLSMDSTGREVHVQLTHPDVTDRQSALNATWGHMVPLGFTPWLRYPVVGDHDMMFHFLGPWKLIYERLIAEGRGHLAWPSVCAAAQTDVGTWKGDKTQERSIQAQLHRVGHNAGPINGIMDTVTIAALDAAGLAGVPMADALKRLCEMPNALPMKSEQGRTQGHIVLPGQQMTVMAYGGIRAVRTTQGAALTVDGPGRLVIDIGG